MNVFRFRLFGALVLAACLAAGAHAQTTAGKAADPAAKAAPGSAPRVVLATSAGDITLELDPEHAPRTVANFLEYVKAGHYDGTIFHRVMDNFMIQAGGFTADMKEKTARAPIPLESNNGLQNKRGTIAMARTNDPNSATAQFFINVADNDFLNYTAPTPKGWGYAAFGRVVAGMDVVDKIRAVATGDRGGMQNVPTQPVTIRSAKIAK